MHTLDNTFSVPDKIRPSISSTCFQLMLQYFSAEILKCFLSYLCYFFGCHEFIFKNVCLVLLSLFCLSFFSCLVFASIRVQKETVWEIFNIYVKMSLHIDPGCFMKSLWIFSNKFNYELSC